MMRKFKDIDVSCAPGEKTEVRIPLIDAALKSLTDGVHALVRCTLLAPDGFRPITAEIIVVPEDIKSEQFDRPMPVGPDAVME